jgi:hypothetical protein
MCRIARLSLLSMALIDQVVLRQGCSLDRWQDHQARLALEAQTMEVEERKVRISRRRKVDRRKLKLLARNAGDYQKRRPKICKSSQEGLKVEKDAHARVDIIECI